MTEYVLYMFSITIFFLKYFYDIMQALSSFGSFSDCFISTSLTGLMSSSFGDFCKNKKQMDTKYKPFIES